MTIKALTGISNLPKKTIAWAPLVLTREEDLQVQKVFAERLL